MKAADVKRRWARWRDRLRERPTVDLVYRLTVGVMGTAVLIVGILAIPYPGPGWAIVFIGLGILATEFEWAQRALGYVKQRYDEGMEWFHRQPAVVQILGGLLTALIVALTLWAVGALDWTAERLGFDFEWLNSPIGIGA